MNKKEAGILIAIIGLVLVLYYLLVAGSAGIVPLVAGVYLSGLGTGLLSE